MEIKREHQIHFWRIIAGFLAVTTIRYREFERLADHTISLEMLLLSWRPGFFETALSPQPFPTPAT
jgi:hypothetical protein